MAIEKIVVVDDELMIRKALETQLRNKGVRNKSNLLLNLSFNNILTCIEKEHPSIQVVSKNPQLFYRLIQSIESKDPLHFNVFLKELSSISAGDKKHFIEGIIAFISGSDQSVAFGQLFYPFFNNFTEDEHFFTIQEPVLALVDSLVHLLQKTFLKFTDLILQQMYSSRLLIEMVHSQHSRK